MCTKNAGEKVLLEGDIYYRYSARSEKIKYPELKEILDESKELEQKKWMEHLQNIAKIGPENIALLDVYRGSINHQNKQILIDSNILKDIKLIHEGKFVEKDGAPALTIIGEVKGMEGIETIIPTINLDEDFLTTKELGAKLGILSDKGSTTYLTSVIKKYKIQENPKYYQFKNNIKYYSKLCFEYLHSLKINLETAKEIHIELSKR